MPAPKKKPARPEPAPDRHKNAIVSCRPPAEMRAILLELARQERRTVSQVVQFLLEDALTAKKLWPPTG
jgi:hypothetical protein